MFIAVACNGGLVEQENRTRKWRERRKAEGKKSFTVLLSVDAQQVIKAEKERTGENYSAIIEKALLNRAAGAPGKVSRRELPASEPGAPAAGNAQGENKHKKPSVPILIDDLENYSIDSKQVDFGYKRAPEQGINRKESFFSRLVKRKPSGAKGWLK